MNFVKSYMTLEEVLDEFGCGTEIPVYDNSWPEEFNPRHMKEIEGAFNIFAPHPKLRSKEFPEFYVRAIILEGRIVQIRWTASYPDYIHTSQSQRIKDHQNV